MNSVGCDNWDVVVVYDGTTTDDAYIRRESLEAARLSWLNGESKTTTAPLFVFEGTSRAPLDQMLC
jgi:hypothetical protein